MSTKKQILLPPATFSHRHQNLVRIVGRFLQPNGSPAKAVFAKTGDRTLACRPNEEGEFELAFHLPKGFRVIRLYAVNEKKHRYKIGTRIILLSPPPPINLPASDNARNLRRLFPGSFFNQSADGHVRLSGVFSDSQGRPAKQLTVRLGDRTIHCDQTDGAEFRFTFKTSPGFKFLRITALTERGKRVSMGRRLYHVLPAPEALPTSRIEDEDYQLWLRLNEKPNSTDEARVRTLLDDLREGPTFAVLLNGKAPPTEFTEGSAGSVRRQLYERRELLVTTSSASTSPEVLPKDEHAIPNDGPHDDASQFNLAAAQTKADFLLFLRPDERLPPHALLDAAHALSRNPRIRLLYGDEDEIHMGGYRSNPDFKAARDSVRLLNHNYIGRNFIVSCSLFRKLKGFRENPDLDAFHDFLLRADASLADDEILHLPRILRHHLPFVRSRQATTQARERRRRHTLHRNHPTPEWSLCDDKGILRHRPPPPSPDELVSIIMPSACKLEFLRPCIESLSTRTTHPSWELILVVNEIRRQVPEQDTYLQDLAEHSNIRIILYSDQSFNYSKIINMGVAEAKGDKLCLLNDDVEVISPDWLQELLSWLAFPGAGAVGARLLYPDGSIQHAGITLGMNGMADHVEKGALREDAGDYARILFPRRLTCVTAGCMALDKRVFDQLGGFNENLPQAYNDVDFCIRLGEAGFHVLWTPFAELYHHESVSVERPHAPARRRIFREEMNLMLETHGKHLAHDPHYSPNHSDIRPYFHLAFPPRRPAPWKETASLAWESREPLDSYKGEVSHEPDKVAVFSHFDQDNLADPYVLNYLAELKRLGWSITFVTSCPEFPAAEIAKLSPLVSSILRSDGKGRDWGNFGLGLRRACELSPPRSLLLLNDSAYGPLAPLDELFARADAADADFIGLTDSPQHRYHLQSYFLYCKPSLCSHLAFSAYWKAFVPQPHKNLIIRRNEIDFTQHFANLGFQPAALYAYGALLAEAKSKDYWATPLLKEGQHVNPSHYFWDVLLTVFDFPFLKIELLRDNPSQIPGLSFVEAYLRQKNPAAARIIIDHLERITCSTAKETAPTQRRGSKEREGRQKKTP